MALTLTACVVSPTNRSKLNSATAKKGKNGSLCTALAPSAIEAMPDSKRHHHRD